jgi:hypothetical protein
MEVRIAFPSMIAALLLARFNLLFLLFVLLASVLFLFF